MGKLDFVFDNELDASLLLVNECKVMICTGVACVNILTFNIASTPTYGILGTPSVTLRYVTLWIPLAVGERYLDDTPQTRAHLERGRATTVISEICDALRLMLVSSV